MGPRSANGRGTFERVSIPLKSTVKQHHSFHSEIIPVLKPLNITASPKKEQKEECHRLPIEPLLLCSTDKMDLFLESGVIFYMLAAFTVPQSTVPNHSKNSKY